MLRARAVGSLRPPSQQLPVFQLFDRGVEAATDFSMTASAPDVLDRLELGGGCAGAFALQLDGEDLAAMDRDYIRHAGTHAEAFQNFRLDARSPTAVGRVKGEEVGRAAHAQMIKHRALDDVLRAVPSARRPWSFAGGTSRLRAPWPQRPCT